MKASPPAIRTASQMASSSATTTTGPHSASTARRQTWTIMGSPAMSARGLSGSLVAFSLAGMTIRLGAIFRQITRRKLIGASILLQIKALA